MGHVDVAGVGYELPDGRVSLDDVTFRVGQDDAARHNPALPEATCRTAADYPHEAIVVRFATKSGIRELWVAYDGCVTPGFYTADGRKGLYADPLRLLATGPARPAQGTWLASIGW